ncbi:MAG: hypothetical protein IJR71_00370 [Prevotella sp.]|nr:hypothetical protein [Prevotella sp.]
MTWKNGGVLESISSTAYIVGNKIIFTLILLFIGGLLLPTMLDVSSEDTKFLAFLTIVGLSAVAMTPNYRSEDGLQHNIGGIGCCVCSQLLVAFNQPFLLLMWLPCLAYLLFFRDKNYTFWTEITCMAIIYVYSIWPSFE